MLNDIRALEDGKMFPTIQYVHRVLLMPPAMHYILAEKLLVQGARAIEQSYSDCQRGRLACSSLSSSSRLMGMGFSWKICKCHDKHHL